MKKPLFVFIIVLAGYAHVFSQANVYKPFPQGYGYWSVTEQNSVFINYYRYITSGDTLIGAYTYKKVLSSYSMYNPFNFSPYAFGFAYRNDSLNKKVYFLDVAGGANKDTLWYDFNLNIGDTVKNTFAYSKVNLYPYARVVQSIDSILNCGSYYKRFNFACTSGESSLVEGIGFLDHFIHTARGNECPFEPSVVFYTGFSSCNITSVEEHLKDQQIELSPNPTSSELRMSTLPQIAEYAVVNNTGAEVLKGNALDSQSINVAFLPNGLYMVKIQDRSGKHYQSKFIKE